MTLRVATWNERGDKHGVPFPKRAADLKTVLDACDLVGMQEWDGIPGSAKALDEFPGFGNTKPKDAPPVAWRQNRLQLVNARRVLAAKGRHVKPLVGRRSILPDYYLTVATFDRLDNGHHIALINGHSIAHVEIAGLLRPGARGQMYAEWCQAVAAAYALMTKSCDRVFVTADWNWAWRDNPRSKHDPRHVMAGVGAVGCWAHRDAPGTLGRRTVDVIYTSHRGQKVTTIKTGSDHKAVVVEYL